MVDDKFVVEQVLAGDIDAYRYIVDRYQTGLLRYCYSIVLDEDVASDIAQQAFISAYKNLASYKSKYAFSTWLYRIARNEAYKELKNLNRKVEFGEAEDVSEYKLPSEVLDRTFEANRLKNAMSKLRAEWRQVIHFYYWEQKSYVEIADLMGMPLNTIKVWMNRAKKQLEQELSI
jgi:RNA polymerase sigma-70 factor (ECF subfamily)